MRKISELTVEHRVGSSSRISGALRLGRLAVGILGLVLLHSPVHAASVTIAWDANPETNITSYQLSYGTQSGVYTKSINVGADTTVTVSGLVEGITYYFALSAWNTVGQQSSVSDEVVYQVPVSASIPVSGLASVTLAWDANPEANITSYQLNYGTQSGVYPNAINAGAATSATVTGLVVGTTYYFAVSAWNDVGQQSAPSGEVAYQIPVGSAMTLSAWASAANLSGANADPLATPWHDGVPNLLKYAFAMNGGATDVRVIAPGTGTAGLPCITLTGSGTAPVLRFEYLRRKNSTLTYTPRKSPDLQSWQPLSAAVPLAVTDIDTDWERVVFAEPCDPAAPACYGRVEVMLPSL